MKTIVYKMRLNQYECIEIHDNGGDRIKFVFEFPIKAKMLISKTVVDIADGIGMTSIKKIPDGDVTPKLFVGSSVYTIEGFTVNSGTVTRKAIDENYIRNLGKCYEELSHRVENIENQSKELQSLMTQKIKL